MSNKDKLIHQIYDAGLDPTLWIDVVAALRQEFDASTLALHSYNTTTKAGFRPVCDGINPDAIHSYVEHFQYLNVFREPAERLLRPGRPAIDRDIVDRDHVLESEFYNDWMKPYGLDLDQVGAKVAQTEGRMTLLSAHFSPIIHAARKDVAISAIATMSPHLARALALNQRLWAAMQTTAAHDLVLDAFDAAAITIDALGRPIAMNAAAEPLFGPDGFLVVERLGAVKFKDDVAQRVFAARFAQLKNEAETVPAPFMAHGAEGEDLRLIWLLPLNRRPLPVLYSAGLHDGDAEIAVGLVLATAPHAPTNVSAEVLRVAYDITDAEAQLLKALVEGDTLDGYARRENRSLHTIRTHQKRLLHKLQVSRQKDLVAKAISVSTLPLKPQE